MAYYKNTSEYEESKIPLTLQNTKSQKHYQGEENGLKSADTSKYEESRFGIWS